jgi:hypothetical protein
MIDASNEQNSDLFWALKGGGPNFGIVSQFNLYTVPVYKVWFYQVAYSNDQALAILDAFAAWQKGGASDSKAVATLVLGLESITLNLIYLEPVGQPPEAFSVLLDLERLSVLVPPMNTTFMQLNTLISGEVPNTQARLVISIVYNSL